MSVTIEQLELEIQSKSTQAVSGIDALSASLSRLKNATRGGAGLNGITTQIKNLNSAAGGADTSQVERINKLIGALGKLRALNGVKISPTLANQIRNLGGATLSLVGIDFEPLKELGHSLSELSNVTTATGLTSVVRELNKLPGAVASLNGVNLTEFKTKLSELSDDLKPLDNISKSSGLSSIVKALKDIPVAAQGLQKVNWKNFEDRVKSLNSTLSPLSHNVSNVTNRFKSLPNVLDRVAQNTKNVTDSNKKAKQSFVEWYSVLGLFRTALSTGGRLIGGWIDTSNQYIEDVNLFSISMGEYAGQAKEYAEQVGEVMGIDPGEFMRNQGIFNTIITGFGVASDKAYVMSQNLTQLGYDLSSFANISFEDSMKKLSSGISGELEPLRRLGYDLSVARLQEEALALGINKRVSAMTQAEKSQLRYHAIMTQVTIAQGDMGRTLNAPANQLRILKAQVLQASRALGNIFIPILNAVLPYAIALAKVVRLVAQSIASLFKFKMPDVDFGGVSAGASAAGALADNADDAAGGLGKAGKAAKKLKNALLGIDELNIISRDDDSAGGGSGGGGGGVGGGGGFDIPLPTYDFLGNAVSSRVDSIVAMIKDAMWEITAVASGFALAIGTILVATGVNIPLGVALMAVGAAGLVSTIAVNWNKMSDRLARTLSLLTAVLGGFLLAVGAILTFTYGNIPLGVGLMIAGAVMLGTAVAINWKALNGDLTNALSLIEGAIGAALMVVGAVIAFSGAGIPLGIGLMIAGATMLGSAVALNWNKLSDETKEAMGLIGVGVGVALCVGAVLAFSGGAIPLGIGLMIAGATSIASAATLNWGSLTGKTENKLKKLEAIASVAVLGIGLALALSGVAVPVGLGLIAVGATGLAHAVAPDWNYITNKVKSVLKDLGAPVGAALLALGIILCFSPPTLPFGIALIAAGAVGIVSGIAMNWEFIKSKIGGVLDGIYKIAKKAFIPLGLILCFTPFGLPLGLALLAVGAASLVSKADLDWDAIQTKIKEGLDKAAELFAGFAGFVGEVLDEAATHITNWAGDVYDYFTNGDMKSIEEKLRESGKDCGLSFKKGFGDNFVDSKSWVRNTVLNPIENALKNNKQLNVAIGLTNNAPQMWENAKAWWANETRDGLKVETIVKLVKDGWSTVNGWIGKITPLKQAIGLAKEGWDTVANWIGKIPTLDQAIELAKSGWSSVKEWVGDIPTLSQRINLVKQGWDTVNNWIGHIPVLSQAIALIKSGWQTVQGWIGELPPIGQGISLIKNGWSSVKDWIGTNQIDVTVNLRKGAWDAVTNGINSLTDGLNHKLTTSDGDPVRSNRTKKLKKAATGAVITANSWKAMPKYAGGTNRAHGSMFVAGESGAELVGHVNGRTEVINRFQLGAIMLESVVSGMSQFGGYWRTMSRDMVTSANAVINAINVNAAEINENMVLASATGFDPGKSLASSVYENTARSREGVDTDDTFYRNMRDFYHEYLEPTLKDIASDTKRQADKHEQTVVKIGNRTVTDAVTTQKDADGYRFTD